MSPKLFIEVDAGKEQPLEKGWYLAKNSLGQWYEYYFCDGKFIEGHPVVKWLRPIQQQEGLAIEFAEWIESKHYHSWVDVIQGYRLWSNYSPGDERHDKNLTTSELFNQFINSIK